MRPLSAQIAELVDAGYSSDTAQAKVAHDIVLLAMHRCGFKAKSTVKGGVVMSSLTGDIRRATMDMDIDFIGYSISESSVKRFVTRLVKAMPEIQLDMVGASVELKHADYHGRRIYLSVKDSSIRRALRTKIDIGVEKNRDVVQMDFSFKNNSGEGNADLQANSPEQIAGELAPVAWRDSSRIVDEILGGTAMTYFTADQHFGHFNIIRLSHRPFASLDEMNEAMIAKWNAKVKPDDTIFILGDLFFRSATVEPILKRLDGHKHLVLGNHDHSWTCKGRLGDYFESVQTMMEVVVDGMPATLCHYPMLSYPQARRGYMIYGHIHNNTGDDYWPLIMRRPRMLNAGVDLNGFEPVSFDELVSNNAAFRQLHADTARSNPLTMFCAEA